MLFNPGARLGPYEIVSALGRGGMGEVYRARDKRLNRTVAIKVLPSAEPELKMRFAREAKAVAALQHPHICTLFDIGHHNGIDYLVLEYLEGQTLDHRNRRSRLTLDEALTIAIEIASALDRAHHAGIVHRDLNPRNVMLTKSGAKLLDFGLAKLKGPLLPGADESVVTRPASSTAPGTILGTLQYMAPEQLRGKETDHRADIWSFGCVLYELLARRRAFEGDSQATLISAILS